MPAKTKYWCMGCGAYAPEPCELLGHISTKMKHVENPGLGARWQQTSVNTIAADYMGKLTHLPVKLPNK